MKIWKKIKGSLYTKFMILFIVVSVLPIGIIGIVMKISSQEIAEEFAFDKLKAIGELKRDQIFDYFHERQENIYFLAKKHINIRTMNNLEIACSSDKKDLFSFVNTPEYDKIVEITDGFCKDYKQQYGYNDILLIDTAGNILYTVSRKTDLATNIFTGPYKNTSLAKAVREAKKSGRPAISDFELYTPSNNEPTSFIANSIWCVSGELKGFVAIQIPVSQINDLMQKKYGLGFTGESYLVGINYLMRSDSRFEKKTTILKKAIHTESVKLGLEGKQGVHIIQNNRDIPVLSYYAPVGLNKEFDCDFDWAIITEINTDEALASRTKLLDKFKMLGILLILGILIIGFLLSRSITLPITKIANNAKLIALGNLNQKITVKKNDEIGELANSFRDVQNELRQKVDHAKKIADGDYSVKLNPKSNNDELSVALNEMTESLLMVSKENKKSIWVTGSQNDLNEKMRGDLDINTISQNVITCLVEQLDAQVGALFLASENELQLISSYAFTKQKKHNKTIKIGEGIVGQVAFKKKMILLSDIPDDYFYIASGLGNAKPKNIVVLPITLEEKLIGVVELGSFKKFSDNDLALLNILKENIAIGINSALIRLETNKLLEKTKEQALEMAIQHEEIEKTNAELEEHTQALKESEASLQAQQEELKQINEELEEQTKALLKSEDSLQVQQEELRVTNEELEERTKAIEKQRDAINIKNKELKQAQIEIENKARDLEMSSKYKSEFLANMSHELRTPLNSILVLSQLLSTKNNGNLTEKQIELASTINSSGKDLLELINDVLDLSKVESGMMEINIDSVNIEQFVNDMNLKFAHVTKDKGIEFNVNIDKQLPKIIKSDSLRLMQIIKNLLSNAIKYTHNGSVTVDISRPDKNIDLSDSGLDYKKAVSFAVTDTGIGITKEKQKLIFEAFKQADGTISRKYGGTGLGLSISKNFTHLLGGEIQLKSEENKGSCFTLIIPEILEAGKEEESKVTYASKASETTEAPAPEKKITDKPKPEKKKKEEIKEKPVAEDGIKDDRENINKGDKVILAVEDDPNFAQLLYYLAHEKDFKFLLAKNGETGLHYADYYKPSAIILDIGLPGIDGLKVMERLKENPETRHIPVHFMSVSEKDIDAMKMGAIGFLEKPASMKSIKNAFAKIEASISKSVKKLLIVEDDEKMRKSIVELIGEDNIKITAVGTGKEGLAQIKSQNFDCVILDLGLDDISGFEVLEEIRKDDKTPRVPIIIYTGKELTREEEALLKKYADSIIIKGAQSPERLISETTLFLHQVEANLPENKQKMLKLVHNKDAVLEGKTVLIVDDDMRNVFALSSVLEDAKLKIIVGKNGKEGIEQLNKNPEIDLVLMDIMMPEMDGYEAMQEIKKIPKYQKLPIIALTAKAMKGDREKCIKAGANDYMTKPVDTDKLLSLLRVWMYN